MNNYEISFEKMEKYPIKDYKYSKAIRIRLEIATKYGKTVKSQGTLLKYNQMLYMLTKAHQEAYNGHYQKASAWIEGFDETYKSKARTHRSYP